MIVKKIEDLVVVAENSLVDELQVTVLEAMLVDVTNDAQELLDSILVASKATSECKNIDEGLRDKLTPVVSKLR